MLATALAALGLCGSGRAQTADELYKGKQIRFIVGTAAGQDYDSWSRLIGRHMSRFIAGNPTFVVENMPGPGISWRPITCSTWRHGDGTIIGMVFAQHHRSRHDQAPQRPLRPREVQLVGSPELNHRVLFVNTSSGSRRCRISTSAS